MEILNKLSHGYKKSQGGNPETTGSGTFSLLALSFSPSIYPLPSLFV